MKPQPARTFGQLPFQELEPHRFEDLVRQLAYGHRAWATLESIGRSGDDGGVDIRGVEADEPCDAASYDNASTMGGDDLDVASSVAEPDLAAAPRTWLFQVKRQEKLHPAQAVQVARAAVFDEVAPPFAFVLAVSANVSVRTRAALAEPLMERGVQRVLVWGRGELEDMLFDPRNDNLLFAYFGISLQVRSRRMASQLQLQLTRKRQVHRVLGDLRKPNTGPVLLRDPTVDGYPYLVQDEDAEGVPPWVVTAFEGYTHPDGIELVFRRTPAWVSPDRTQYDVVDACSHVVNETRLRNHRRHYERQRRTRAPHEAPGSSGLLDTPMFGPPHDEDECRLARQVHAGIREGERAWFESVGFLRFDDILLVDDVGDVLHEAPHLLVTRDHARGFFSHVTDHLTIDRSPQSLLAPEQPLRARQLNRTEWFPSRLASRSAGVQDS